MGTETLHAIANTVNHIHSAATAALTFYLINGMVLLALNTELVSVENVYVHDCPRVRAPKNTGEAWVVGDKIYWDDTAKDFTVTATANTLAGYVVAAAASADTEGEIALKQYLDKA